MALPKCRIFPCVAVLGVRDNDAGRPTAIEANFVRFVATSFEQDPIFADWPHEPFKADGVHYDGHSLVVHKGGDGYRVYLDRSCPVTLYSVTALPNEFPGLVDPDALELYLQEHEYTSNLLKSELSVSQREIYRERPAQSSPHAGQPHAGQRKAKPLYDRPSTAKTLAWIVVGLLAVMIGFKLIAGSATHSLTINVGGWFAIVAGAVLIVRRAFDLFFPPSRL